ncbi:acetoacetate decarboxylase family protein [Almyronema epifaneia]|uniref:Acetoacetate decarboxylase family protein n=1 Tax=Almyronema epifaneia S1 TaxID=2991925 RepID=A0ABW6IC60_9CYAN
MTSDSTVAYPAAPWHLSGSAIQTVQPISLARSRRYIPANYEIVQIWPGFTLGGLYVAHYLAGSTLSYHELIVIAGVVRYAHKLGFWISHLYVDNPISVAGGREIWGLPKQMAAFSRSETPQINIAIAQANTPFCQFAAQARPLPLPPLYLPVAAFGQPFARTGWFTASARFQLQRLTSVQIQVPASSPFVGLQLDSPWLAFRLKSLQLEVNAPQLLD